MRIARGPERGALTEEEAAELIAAMALLPFYFSDLRLPTAEVVTCSDASGQGAGMCS